MIENGAYDHQFAALGRPRLVLADDDPIVRSTLGGQLQYAFECVGTGSNADEAIALTAMYRPDVTILDVNMPGGGADRATREIRARCPGTAIVILSADERQDEVVELLRSGAITYLRKGITTQVLIAKLIASIEAHSRLEELPPVLPPARVPTRVPMRVPMRVAA